MRRISPETLGQIAYYGCQLICKSVRIKLYCDPAVDLKKPYLCTFWHGKLFLPVSVMPRVGYEKRAVLVSHSKDGEILATWLTRMGYHVVRGSSTRGGMGGLVRLISAAKKGYAIAMAADGPRGPINEVKAGIAFASLKTGLEVLPLGVEVSHKKVLKRSWDQYEVPFPFSKAVFYLEKPLKLSEAIPPEAQREQIAEGISSAQAKAKAILQGERLDRAVCFSLD